MDVKTLALCEAPVCVGSPTQGSEQAYRALKPELVALFGARAQCYDFEPGAVEPAAVFDERLYHAGDVMQVARGV